MRKLVAAALLCSACSLPGYHSVDRLDRTPRAMIFLGQAPQVCAGKGEMAVVDVFVILQRQPAARVKFIVDDHLKVVLFGTSLTLHLAKVGPGAHWADIYVNDEWKGRISWSVFHCLFPEPDPLYSPYKPGEGARLKGYCPEPEPCEPCTTPQ